MSTIPAGRQQYILSLVKTQGSVNVGSLAEQLGVSELTIRRDLDQLATKGLVERTHGGATMRRNLPVEPDYLQKASEYPKEKEAIGKAVAELVEEGDTLYINSGSTTFEVIRAVVALQKKVTIVTNKGGVYRSRSHSVSGSLASMLISQINANKAIIGVDGFSPSAGLTTPILEEADTTRAMIEHTVGTVIVVASSNKIGVVSNFKTVSLDQVDALVTDEMGADLVKQMEIPEDLQIIVATTEV